MLKNLECNLALIIRAKREELRLSTSISVYPTLTPTKAQAFYQCRLGALRIRSTLSAIGQTTTFSGLSLGDFAFVPWKICNIALPVTPQKADKMAVLLYAYFSTPSLRGLCFRPPRKSATLHCQLRPKRRTKWQCFFMHLFLTPLASCL